MPGLLLPAALAALAALVLPLLLHLARRSQQRPTPFAALRWLRHRPRPRQQLRIEDWPLLLLRLLLLALLALWLAQPVLRDARQPTRVVAIAPGIDRDAIPASAAGVEHRWLLPGFPLVDREAVPPPANAAHPLSSLVRELDADLPAAVALTVVVPAVLEHVDAQRLVLGRSVDWRVLPATDDVAAPPLTSTSPALALRHDDDSGHEVRVLRAAAQAWHDTPQASAVDESASTALPAADTPLAWWHAGQAPAPLLQWITRGGTAVLAADVDVEAITDAHWHPLWRDADGAVLLEATPSGAGRALRFTRPLTPEAMPEVLDGGFPRRLRDALQPPVVPARVDAASHAPSRDPALASTPREADTRDLRPWLALLLALVFALERWLATARRRSTGA